MGALLSPFGIGAAREQQSGPAASVMGRYPDEPGSDMSDLYRRSFGSGGQQGGFGGPPGLPGMPPGMGGMQGQGQMGMNPLAMLFGGGGMGGGMQGGQQRMPQQQQNPYGIVPPRGMQGGYGDQQGGGQQGGGMSDPLGIMSMLGGL